MTKASFQKYPTIEQLASEEIPIQSTSFPTFPNLFELASAEDTSAAARPRGLFEDLLGGQAAVLLHDAQKHPNKYDEVASALLQELAAGRRKKEELTTEERGVLDRAVFDFVSYVPPKESTRTPTTQQKQVTTRAATHEVQNSDIPENVTNAYWWL